MAEFLKENSTSLFTLLGVLIGSLIPFWINRQNLRNQAIERDKDRQEQRREAKIQLALELMKNEVEIVEGMVDNTIKALRIIELASFKRIRGELSQDGWRAEILSTDSKFMKLAETSTISAKIAYTFGDKFSSEYDNFQKLSYKYMDMYTYMELASYSENDASNLMQEITESSAKLHTMLKEKLISIRDS
jgi:hypothetical protein